MSGFADIGDVVFDDVNPLEIDDVPAPRKATLWYVSDPTNPYGRPIVEVTLVYPRHAQTERSSGDHLLNLAISPAKARELARLLNEAADAVDNDYRQRRTQQFD